MTLWHYRFGRLVLEHSVSALDVLEMCCRKNVGHVDARGPASGRPLTPSLEVAPTVPRLLFLLSEHSAIVNGAVAAGVSDGQLTADDCHAFWAAALADPLLPSVRFAALLTDFASIPRGEGTSDMLLAYQM